jgi:hypothetical protein
MKQLLDNGVLPNFWNEKVNIDDKDVIVPYNMLEKANNEAMDDFLNATENYLSREKCVVIDKKNIINPKTGETNYEWNIKTNWNNALMNPKQKVIDELLKLTKAENKTTKK